MEITLGKYILSPRKTFHHEINFPKVSPQLFLLVINFEHRIKKNVLIKHKDTNTHRNLTDKVFNVSN